MVAQLDPVVEFREDHRQVRDDLLALASAAQRGDLDGARASLGRLDALVGPHFRYEEEALYPAMREFLGGYVDQLLAEHDTAISTARTAAEVLSQPALTEEERGLVATAARSLLVHVSNCDGLNILTERLTAERLGALAGAFEGARAANVPLLEWAATIRQR